MTLRARLSKLERKRTEPDAASVLALNLPPGLCARITAAQAAGTFPQSLACADLKAILAAADVGRGQA